MLSGTRGTGEDEEGHDEVGASLLIRVVGLSKWVDVTVLERNYLQGPAFSPVFCSFVDIASTFFHPSL